MFKKIPKFGMLIQCITGILFAGGLFMIFNAAPLGSASATNYLITVHGGSMDSSQFLVILETGINSYIVSGFLISLLGGAGLIITSYIIYRKMEK